MKQHSYCLVCLVFNLFTSPVLFGQSTGSDSAFYNQSIKNAIGYYMTSLGETSQLYSGSEYIYLTHGIKGHPFFGSGELQKGIIDYDGVVYPDVPFAYDLVTDVVFTNDPTLNFNIRWNVDRIRSFYLGGHTFIRITGDSSSKNALPEGFYDLLHNGKTQVLAKRTKRAETSLRAEDSTRFVSYNQYFVRNKNTYTEIDDRKSLLSVFGDAKDEIKKFYRGEKLNYKKDPEKAIVKVAEYYDEIKK